MMNRLSRAAVVVLALASASACVVIAVWPRAVTPSGEPAQERPQCSHWSVFRCCQLLGAPVGMDTIAKMLPYDQRGHTMLQLSELLEKIGFETEGSRGETYSALVAGDFPCIAHLTEPDHFVVVSGVSGDQVHVFDGLGRRTTRVAGDFCRKWSGTVLRVQRKADVGPLPAFLSRDTEAAPCVQFETLLIDKGTVPASAKPVVFEYHFENVGSTDLAIKNVHAGCKCIEVEKPQEPIPAGGQGAIKLLYHIQPKKGPFSYRTVVETNDPQFPAIVLNSAGFTGLEVNVRPRTLDLGNIPYGRPHSARLFVSNSGDWANFRLEAVNMAFDGVELLDHSLEEIKPSVAQQLYPGAPEDLSVASGTRILVLSILPSKSALGRVQGTLSLRTSIEGYEQFSIRVTANVCSPVTALPGALDFGGVDPQETVRRAVTLVSIVHEPFQIVAVTSDDSDLACDFAKSIVDRETQIEFHTTGVAALKLAGKTVQIRVRLVDSGDEISVPLSVSVWQRAKGRDK